MLNTVLFGSMQRAMNGFGAMFAITSAMVFIVIILVFVVTIKRFSKNAFGTSNISEVIKQQDTLDQTTPKSLSGMDYIYLPQIMEDFPDFNSTLAETKVKNKLYEVLKGKEAVHIHNVVISNYERTSVEKTIHYQAALQYRENGRLNQKRYCLHYSFMLATDEGNTLAANCPNCGGAISSTNQTVCEYCDSRLVNVLGNSWEFTDVYEG